MPKSTSRVLLLQLKRIGDTILTAPAMAAAREACPDSEIIAVVSGASANLAPAFGSIDAVWNYAPGGLNLGIWKQLVSGRFDACLDFTGTDRSALMSFLSKAKVRAGYEKFAKGKRWRSSAYNRLSSASVRDLHTVDFHLTLIDEGLGKSACLEPASGFVVPNSVGAGPESLEEEFVLVHPGTARKEKYWPADRWGAVIDHLKFEHGLNCVVTGSDDAAERAHLVEVKSGTKAGFLDLSGRLSLLELAKVISRSRLAIGVDSAAMHLAAMQEVRQIVLFGPTNPYHWRPRHERGTVLLAGENTLDFKAFQPNHHRAPMTDLSTETVRHAIDSQLADARRSTPSC